MSEGQLNHLSDLGHLLAAASNIVVSDTIGSFFVFSADGLTFVEQGGVGADDTVLRRVNLDNLELNGLESTSDNESVVLLDGTVAVLEVGDQVSLGDVSSKSFDRVGEG